MTDDMVGGQWRLPDLERCLTRYLGETLDFSDCLVKNPHVCEYAVRSDAGIYCRHPGRRNFETADPP